ncbi:MAG: pal [Herminiimonas sp.]|nr:pal [Herminiimonas sp.]
MGTLKTLTVILSSALFLTACATAGKSNDSTAASNKGANKADPRTVATVNATSTDPLNDPKGILAKRSVYFEYDSYLVKSDYNPVVSAHAKYLEEKKNRKIVIQGNTDERGGSEYNLALGQKRAEAVRKSLMLLGVPNTQMEAVSFGKEKPKAHGNDEASWTENRRADIVYQ